MIKEQLDKLEASVDNLLQLRESSIIRRTLNNRSASEEDVILESLDRARIHCREYSSRTPTDIPTPVEVVDQMVAEVFKKIKITPELRILDPACGRGTFLFQIAKKLIISLRESFPEPKKRLQYIQKKMLLGIEIDPELADLVISMGFNILQENTLEYNFMGKTFDIVIMNPPFGKQGSLAKEFVQLGIKLSTQKLGVIQPYNQLTYSTRVAKFYKSMGLKTITNVSDSFRQLTQRTAYYVFDRQHLSKIVDDQMQLKTSLQITDSVADMMFTISSPVCRNEYENKLKDTGAYKIIVTTTVIRYTDDASLVKALADRTRGSWRVLFNRIGGRKDIGRVVIAHPGDVAGYSVNGLIVASKQEAIEYKKYLESDTFKDLMSQIKTSVTNSKKYFAKIPKLP